MKSLVVLGAGTGGTTIANRMRRRLVDSWNVTVVDPDPLHLYQPALLFIPFGGRTDGTITHHRARTLRRGIDWIQREVEGIDPATRTVSLSGGLGLGYDLLVIATGAQIRPDLTPGLEPAMSRGEAHDFYTLPGAMALARALGRFEGGRLVVNLVKMPIKYPPAPLEFLFLADDFLRHQGLRERTELVYATPLDTAFTPPAASERLEHMLEDRGIQVETSFSAGEVDADHRVLRSRDQREVPYDLLVSIPIHSGASFLEGTPLGDELAFVPTDPATLQVKGLANAFALGDATDVPASKAGSVAHFQAMVLEENLLRAVRGEAPLPLFDGHADCFVESGGGKAMLIDFSYGAEPLPGHLGPFPLLRESRLSHLGMLAFRPLYWSALLPGRPLPLPHAVLTDEETGHGRSDL